MSKPVKNMIIDLYRKQFADISGAVLIDIRGLNSKQTLSLRSGLAKKQIRVTVVKNNLARKAFDDMPLKAAGPLMEGPVALITGADGVVTVAREVVEMVKKLDKVTLKGAVMDGEVFDAKDVKERLSKYPTRVEAQCQVIQIILSPAGQVIGAATSAGSQIAGVIEALEKKLEKGEAVAKTA